MFAPEWWFKVVMFSALSIVLLVEVHVFAFLIKDEIKRREWPHVIFESLLTLGLTYGCIDLALDVRHLICPLCS